MAAAQFAQHGFHGVSMRDIARENSSSVASLYNHFQSKDDLLLGVGRRFLDPFVKRLESAAVIEADSRLRMVEMLRVSIQEGLRRRDEYVSISRGRHHMRASPELRLLVDDVERCLALWYRVMRAGQADRSIRADLDPATTIWAAMSAITGLVDTNSMTAVAGRPPTSPVATLCMIFSEGLRPATVAQS